jgi:hypothetical protein
VDADRDAVVEGVSHLVHVADRRRHRLHLAPFQAVNRADRREGLAAPGEPLRQLGPAQHANQAPDGVVVDGRGLARSPDEADHAEPLAAVAMQQVLLVAGRVGQGVGVRQPVVVGDQPRQQLLALREDPRLLGGLVDHGPQSADEIGQPGKVGAGRAHRVTACI